VLPAGQRHAFRQCDGRRHLLKLVGFTNDLRYVDVAREALVQMQTPTGGGMISQYPLGFGQWPQAPCYALSQPPILPLWGMWSLTTQTCFWPWLWPDTNPSKLVAVGHPDIGSACLCCESIDSSLTV
jgi:hypothetical protein